ncbi:hypothetical protein [Methanococcoides sp. NM1]|nr:hypothetical protein [Methanococcoides sp. NM1]
MKNKKFGFEITNEKIDENIEKKDGGIKSKLKKLKFIPNLTVSTHF